MELVWRTASYSQAQGGSCVAMACQPSARWVRDSKNPDGPLLRFPIGATAEFLAAVKSDRLG